MHESTYTQDSRTSRHTDKSESAVCFSPLPIHGSKNLLKATRCSHTVTLSLNTCLSFFGACIAPQPLVIEEDEAITEVGKGTLHSVGKSRKQAEESRGRRKKKITGWLWERVKGRQ